MLAAVVSEGPTDFEILRELIHHICPEVTEVRRLHPDIDKTTSGGGWTEVRKWCHDHRDRLADFLTYRFSDPLDLIVIHIDGDRAAALGIPTEGRTPAQLAQAICDTVKSWLGAPQRTIPAQVIITIPMQSTEAWLVAGLLPQGTVSLEEIPRPVERLMQAGLLERDTDGVAIKDLRRYRRHAAELVKASAQLFSRAHEARRFRGKIQSKCVG